MASEPPENPSPDRGKLSGWPRPRSSIAKRMGLNPLRIALLIVMALVGLGGGYFLGKEVVPAPQSPPDPLPKTPPVAQMADTHVNHNTPNGLYEESLPRDIIIESGGVLKRIALPEPDAEIDLGNGNTGTPGPAAAETAPEPEPAAAPTAPLNSPENPAIADKQPETHVAEPAQQTETAARQQAALPENIAELQRTDADDLPPWQRYALPVALSGKPKIVIVIDDLGLDRRRARLTADLPGPLTLAFMAYAENLPQQAETARNAGHELMLHVPMEPSSTSINPGPNVLLSGMPKSELIKNIEWNLDQMSGYVGVNNHMGSRFTADAESMQTVVAALKERGYLFLDSVTSGRSVAHEAARDGGIPFAVRNVFLDHDDDLAAIRTQLRHTEQIARKTGLAIAIGHPRDKTIEALTEWLPTLADKGFQLVPISAVVRISKN